MSLENSLTCVISESSKLAYDIEQVEDYENIGEFLNFINNNNLSIYTPIMKTISQYSIFSYKELEYQISTRFQIMLKKIKMLTKT